MKTTLLATLLAIAAQVVSAQTIDLSGEWQFSMGDTPRYNDKITLPGSMLTNGKGDDVSVSTKWVGSLYDSSFYFNPYMEKYRVEGNTKFPFFLTPGKHYVGTAWYAKTVFVPASWKGRRVILHLERPHIETTVFVNGREAGRDSSLSVPHIFDVTGHILPGRDNQIAIRIYNGIEHVCVGKDSHSVTDQTQGDWNGIIGRMELQCRPQCYIKNVQVYPNVSQKNIRVRISTAGKTPPSGIQLSLLDGGKPFAIGAGLVSTKKDDGTFEYTIPMGDNMKLWDEFTPHLYTLRVTLGEDERDVTFGMREISAQGRKMILNGHELFIRGTVGNCCFPLTGYPPTDVASWLSIFSKCKQYGLNTMRFHSYCPPEAAFTAADQAGFYLQPEGPSWPNHGVKLGNGMAIDRYLLEETQRMVDSYGNHPSFLFLAAGNEPAGSWVRWAGDFVDYWHSTGDTRRLYCGASVGGGWAFDPKSDYHVKGGARGLDWDSVPPHTMDDFSAAVTQFTQKGRTPQTFHINEPYISHEQGQWCAFPDFKEISQYTGAYKAGNLEIFRDLLRDNGMETQAEKFLHASSQLQRLAYKFETERNLRTPDYTGFQYLALNDYSGQGTALVGPLNVFWKEKSHVQDKEAFRNDWLSSCSPVVILARLPKFVYTDTDTLRAEIELYNATADPIRGSYSYSIASGTYDEQTPRTHPVGKNIPLGKIEIPVSQLAEKLKSENKDNAGSLPAKIPLELSFSDDHHNIYKNTYHLWVYPSTVETPKLARNIYISDTLDAKAEKVLRRGGRVLLTSAGRVTMGSDVVQTYLPVFWNTSWFKMRPPHTTGASIDTAHPLFTHFPTDDWAGLNWWELLNKAQVINLQDFPRHYQPPIQPIDTWHLSRKLGMIAEANIGKGKLLITTMDISSGLEHRPVARQMRKALLEYISSPHFRPSITVDLQVIKSLYTSHARPVGTYTNDSPDELKQKAK